MKLTFDQTAAYIRPRAWLAFFASGLMWGIWLLLVALGGTQIAEHHFTPAPGGYDIQLQGRVGLGNGEWDATKQVVSIDHVAFYTPAKLMREGQTARIYDHEFVGEYQAKLFPEGIFTGKLEAYRNPPFYMLLYYPTSTLSYGASCWLWNGIGLICFAIGVHLLRPARPWQIIVWSMTFYPTFTVIGYGQNSMLTFLVYCLVYRVMEQNRNFAAGMIAGLLWFKPPLLVGLFIWWLIDYRRMWPALAGSVVAGALLLAVTYPIVPEGWNQFFIRLPENMSFDRFQWWKCHNARSFWRLLLTTDSAPLPTILWLVSVGLGVLLFYKVWRAQRGQLPILFAASLLLMFWASPHKMVYEWVGVIIPAVLLWKTLPEHRNMLLTMIGIMWVALFISTDFGQIQEIMLVNRWHYENPMIVQVSIPVYAWVCWRLSRLLIQTGSPATEQVRLDGSPPTDNPTANTASP